MIFSYKKKPLFFPYINKILLSTLFDNIHKREINEGSNSLSSSDAGAYVCIIFIKFGQTEVRYLRIKIFIKQNISSLDVSMNNLQSWLFMKISQTSCYPNTDLMSCHPIQLQLAFFWAFNLSNLIENQLYIYTLSYLQHVTNTKNIKCTK